MSIKKDLNSFRRINKLIHWKWKVLYVIGTIGIAGIYSSNQILASFINKEILDAAIEMSKSRMFTAVCLALIVLACACIVNPVSVFIFDLSVRKAMIGIQEQIFDKIQKLPVSYHYKNHSGDVMARVNNSVNSIEMAYSMHLFRFVEAALWGIGSLVSMFLLDFRITIVMVVYSILVVYCNTYFTKKVRWVEDKLQLINAKNIEAFEEIIKGIRIIKIFHIGDVLQKKFEAINQEYAENKVKRGVYDAEISVVNYLFAKLSLFILIAIGGYFAFHNEASFGSILALVGLQGGVSNMFSNIGSIINDLQGAWAGANRVFEILDEQEEELNNGNEFKEIAKAPAISVENLNFSYEEKTVLTDISFKIKKGEYVALIGKSGSGKSTLAKLLLGLYQADKGVIELFGNSSKAISNQEWRKNIAYVSQNAILFDGSIRDNILYGRQDATEEMVIEAAKKANAHEFILGLQDGYDYNAGENGSNLSGGQKQRIALARAILKDAKVMVIDEGTSALDKESEEMVQKSIQKLKGQWTIIQIIHNLSMIKGADKVYVMENGKIVKSGEPKEVLG